MIVDKIGIEPENAEIGILFVPGWVTGTFEGEFEKELLRLVRIFEKMLQDKQIAGARMTYTCTLTGDESLRVQENMVTDIQDALAYCRQTLGWKRIRIFAKGGSAWLVSKAGHKAKWGNGLPTMPRIERMCFFEPILNVSEIMKQSFENKQTIIKGKKLDESFFKSFYDESSLWLLLDETAPPTLLISASHDEFCQKSDLNKMGKAVEILRLETVVGHNMLEDKANAPDLVTLAETIMNFLFDGLKT